MPYVIASPCIADYSCVEVCPVDCISPGPEEPGFGRAEQMYIDPTRCIDCAACVEVCPVNAIFDRNRLPERWQRYAQINAEYFQQRGKPGHA